MLKYTERLDEADSNQTASGKPGWFNVVKLVQH